MGSNPENCVQPTLTEALCLEFSDAYYAGRRAHFEPTSVSLNEYSRLLQIDKAKKLAPRVAGSRLSYRANFAVFYRLD
jgi:hypothetical protein